MFTQTPGFCSNFVMPSNNFVIITNYITVTNGVLPANPAVTATLQCNGTNLIALSNPTYNSAAGYLVWSGVLTSNLTVPAGQVISYVISNGQAGVVFHVNYDSTNAPSKIILPASTVINVNTLGVYDAPYPGGNLVTAPVAGSTVYVRANVSDPFGSYDITSLGLAITAPSPSANVNVVLNDANAVANDGCSKTYEYAWQLSLIHISEVFSERTGADDEEVGRVLKIENYAGHLFVHAADNLEVRGKRKVCLLYTSCLRNRKKARSG